MASEKDQFEAKFGADTSEFLKALKKIEKNTKATMDKVSAVTNTAAIAFVGLGAAVAATTATFVAYEKGLIAVQKTTNLSNEEIDALGDELINLSKKAPLAVDSLLEIAETAGQLGIKGAANIVKFTETIAKLETTTNLQGQEAAKTLARILTLTGENVGNVDKLGSAFVRLGNNVAASELEISQLALEVSKSTSIFNIGSEKVVGLSATLAELGVQAELGGSTVGKAFIAIRGAIDKGGDSLKELSKATGIAAEDLKQAFEKDATSVFIKFLTSVRGVVDSGGNATKFLEKFGLSGAGVSKVIAPLAQNVDRLVKNLKSSALEYQNATALQNEFKKASESLSSQLTISKNKLEDANRTLGEAFAPTVIAVTTSLANFINLFSQLDSSTITLIARLGLTITAVAGVATAIGLAVKGVLALRLAFGALALFLGPTGLIISGLVLATTAVIAFFATAPKEAEKGNKKLLSEQEKADKGLLQAKNVALQKTIELIDKANAKQLEKTKTANQKQLDEVSRLVEARKTILDSVDVEELANSEERALKELAIETAKLEKISLEKQGATEQTLELKNAEISELSKLQRLETENAVIAAKSEKTALEIITSEKNKILIKQQKEKLEEIFDQQSLSNDVILADIGTFEEDTRELIANSFEEKLKIQTAALEKIDNKLQDINQRGSYPSQEKLLTDSLEFQSDELTDFFAEAIKRRQQFMINQANVIAGRPLVVAEPTDTSTTDTSTTDDRTVEEIAAEGGGASVTEKSTAPIIQSSVSSKPVSVGAGNNQTQIISRQQNLTANESSDSQLQTVIVEIELKDNLTNFVSATQRQQSDLGVSRK